MTTAAAGYRNHNVRCRRVITGAVPPGCGAAIDAGCGDGLLTRKLAGRSRLLWRCSLIRDKPAGQVPAGVS